MRTVLRQKRILLEYDIDKSEIDSNIHFYFLDINTFDGFSMFMSENHFVAYVSTLK